MYFAKQLPLVLYSSIKPLLHFNFLTGRKTLKVERTCQESAWKLNVNSDKIGFMSFK